jgi:hypothetical protein
MVKPLLAAEDLALAFLPGEILPGHQQGRPLGVGTYPLTHRFPLQDPGPLSAYPGPSPWPRLLRASSPLGAAGGPRLDTRKRRELPAGSSVPWLHGSRLEDEPIHRVCEATPAGPCHGCQRPLLGLLAPACPPLALGGMHDGSPVSSLARSLDACSTGFGGEAARYRRCTPLQPVADQARGWGGRLHPGVWGAGLAPA